ncbi:hypothetical protein R3P38DRAFT_3195445 [Favolaschia claudopus]|uniref:ABM domain-containing protein n=1 Tax=Favolaschia claudopus TaxID=2862362 RepID=A0AAW0BCP9_9AGAR
MSSSLNMDIFHSLFIHKAPASASILHFEQTVEALIDELVLLPVAQENLMKVEMIFQTDKGDNHTPAFGLGSRPPTVFVVVRTQTVEQLGIVLAAQEVRKLAQKYKDLGIQSAGFSMNVVPKIDRPAPDNGLHMVFVYDDPPELVASQNHLREFEETMRGFALLPAIQKNFARFEMWQSTDIVDRDVRDVGYSTQNRPTLYYATAKDIEAAKEMMSDTHTQRYFASAAEGSEQFDPKKYGYAFVANVVTKLDHTKK